METRSRRSELRLLVFTFCRAFAQPELVSTDDIESVILLRLIRHWPYTRPKVGVLVKEKRVLSLARPRGERN